MRSRLVSPFFTMPSEDENPRLRFWHWFSFSSSDYGLVQVRTKNGAWQTVYSDYAGSGSGVWTYPSIDLAAFADSTVQIGFYFRSDNYLGGSADVSSGWYIDDFQIVTGPYIYNNPETFESGIGDWSSQRGTWEIGTPVVGPDSTFSGTLCAGTRLNGTYSEGVRSRLISPDIIVPSADQNPRVRFWHWFSFSSSDYGRVQVRTKNGAWQTIYSDYAGSCSGVWTYP